MSEPRIEDINLQSLAELDQVVHFPTRLMVLAYLYVVESADYVYLVRLTGLSWGNLATHINKLVEAGYVEMEKGYQGRKPHTMIKLTPQGREAFTHYKQSMRKVLDDLPG